MASSPHRRRVNLLLGLVAAVPTLLLAVGSAPASADPAPGCASSMAPIVNECTDPILVLPQQPMPPDDYWNDPLLPERAVDNFINQFAPDDFVIGNLSPYEIAPGEEAPGIIPLLPPQILPDDPPEGGWPEEGH